MAAWNQMTDGDVAEVDKIVASIRSNPSDPELVFVEMIDKGIITPVPPAHDQPRSWSTPPPTYIEARTTVKSWTGSSDSCCSEGREGSCYAFCIERKAEAIVALDRRTLVGQKRTSKWLPVFCSQSSQPSRSMNRFAEGVICAVSRWS